MGTSEYALIGQVALGYAFQWLRGLKNVPNWLVWCGLTATSLGVYLWVTPAVDLFGNWRGALAGFVSFLLAAKGGGSASADAKTAPRMNSI